MKDPIKTGDCKRMIPAALFIVMAVMLMGIFFMGCNQSGSEETGAYVSENMPQKFTNDMPGSVEAGSKNTTNTSGTSRAKTTGTKSAQPADTSPNVCEPNGYYEFKEIVSEMVEFRAETQYEFMIVDSLYQGAESYVAENGNPVPAGTLETAFTAQMKVTLMNQFPEEVYGKEFRDMVSSALDVFVGMKILNPEMTLNEDPGDSDNDGYHYEIMYDEIDGPDLDDIISDALEYAMSAAEAKSGDLNKEYSGGELSGYVSEDVDYDEFNVSETTIVKWSDDKTIVSVSTKESGEFTYQAEGSVAVNTGSFESIELCQYDSVKGATLYAENEKDSFSESKSSVLMEENGIGNTVKIKVAELYKSFVDNYESNWQMEIVAGDEGGQMIETGVFTDPADSTKKITESFKETFDKYGYVTGVYYKENGSDLWLKGECDYSFEEPCDECYFDASAGAFIESEICIAVSGISETDIAIVLIPNDVAGPGELGFDELDFFSNTIGFGCIEANGVTVNFWGDEDEIGAGVKVYKEMFDNEGNSVSFTLLADAVVTVTACKDLSDGQ